VDCVVQDSPAAKLISFLRPLESSALRYLFSVVNLAWVVGGKAIWLCDPRSQKCSIDIIAVLTKEEL
jgi:hypothetical protein